MTLEAWLLIAAIVVSLTAITLAVLVLRSQRTLARTAASAPAAPVDEAPADDAPRGPLLAFVANPSKNGAEQLKAALMSRCTAEGLPDPIWVETTVEDPGLGQTREALERGADVVVAVGGDGTVRAVAQGMADSGKPMALLPLGTGNLLARNLDISVTDRDDAFDIVLHGVDRRIDVGWLTVDQPADPHEKDTEGNGPADTGTHIFLVIAGLGFDAAMVADADDELKAKVGWVAYFVAGIRHLHGRRMRARIQLDDSPPVDARLRSLMIGNCGRLPGGITLLPDAVIDDGVLDVAAVDTRGGVVGWAQLFGEVVMQGLGVRNDLPAKIGRIDHARARRVRVRVEEGEQAQVDGDVLGLAVEIETRVDPGALVVRTA